MEVDERASEGRSGDGGEGGGRLSESGAEGDAICRICFETAEDGGEALIAPCKCKGSSKWIHLGCLRRWQRASLASGGNKNRDLCSTCKGMFTCPSLTQMELLVSVTGQEIADMVSLRHVIAASREFTNMMTETLQTSPREAQMAGYRHWVCGVYLIVGVTEAEKVVTKVDILDEEDRNVILTMLDAEMRLSNFPMDKLEVVRSGPFQGIGTEDHQKLREVFISLKPPFSLDFISVVAPGPADDMISAVNLSRRMGPLEDVRPRSLQEFTRAKLQIIPRVDDKVELEFFQGGPCDPSTVSYCILPGGEADYTIVVDIFDALETACDRVRDRLKNNRRFAIGQRVRLKDNSNEGLLEGHDRNAIVSAYAGSQVKVIFRTSASKLVTEEQLEPLGAVRSCVWAFFGCAQWSRSQLLGEVAAGSWGMTSAIACDFMIPPKDRWDAFGPRLKYAPLSEMSEEYMRSFTNQRIATAQVGTSASEDVTSAPAPAPAPAPLPPGSDDDFSSVDLDQDMSEDDNNDDDDNEDADEDYDGDDGEDQH